MSASLIFRLSLSFSHFHLLEFSLNIWGLNNLSNVSHLWYKQSFNWPHRGDILGIVWEGWSWNCWFRGCLTSVDVDTTDLDIWMVIGFLFYYKDVCKSCLVFMDWLNKTDFEFKLFFIVDRASLPHWVHQVFWNKRFKILLTFLVM